MVGVSLSAVRRAEGSSPSTRSTSRPATAPAPVGVLALQGDFQLHQTLFANLNQPTRAVRYPEELDGLLGLVIPGGESTTISRLLERGAFHSALSAFAISRPIFGICAGLILIASDPEDARVQSLNILDLTVSRNAWGRQVHSFLAPVRWQFNGVAESSPGVFIRAPRITQAGPGVEVLARIDGEPVLVREGRHMGATFHPELARDSRIHALFLAGCETQAVP